MYKGGKVFKRILILFMTLGLASGCGLQLEHPENIKPVDTSEVESSVESVEVLIEIYVDDEELEEFTHSYEVVRGTMLLDLMKEHYRLVSDEGYITCIEGNGQRPEENRYWVFDINGSIPEVKASEYELQDGDVVEWKLTSFE